MAMSETLRPFPKETKIHDDVKIITMNEANSWEQMQAAILYYHSWHQYGLCNHPSNAWTKMKRFDPLHTHLLIDNKDKENGVIAVINTLSIFEPEGINGIMQNYGTYERVEKTSMSHQRATVSPNYLLCFSVAADLNYNHKVKSENGHRSPSKHLILELSNPPFSRKIAYSRVKGPVGGKQSLFDFYHQHYDQDDTDPLGPVGMHEHYGGLVVAVLNRSREEDTIGGRGNILVAYPNNSMEQTHFDRIKSIRKDVKKYKLYAKPYEKVGSNVIYTDY
jgi:hypothetical protein